MFFIILRPSIGLIISSIRFIIPAKSLLLSLIIVK
ncbi:MAG: hypothetical protein ACI9WS_003179 [Paraglaciecola psychrophila]